MPEILGNINDLRAALEHEKRHVWQLNQLLTVKSQSSPLQGEVFSCKNSIQHSGTVIGWYRFRMEIDAIKWQVQSNSSIYQQSSAYYKQTYVTEYLNYCYASYDGLLKIIPDFKILSTIQGFISR